MIKYDLTKLSVPASSDKERARNCWFKIPINQVKDLFEDERFTGEICHLYNDWEDGCESLMDNPEKLGDAIFEAMENHTPFVVYMNDVYAQSELFEIRGELT